MRKKNYKGRCIKQQLPKFKDVCRTYDALMTETAKILAKDESIIEICCNVPLEGIEADNYTTDFVCKKEDGSLMVRECVYRKHITKPLTMNLLDMSYQYWKEHGVTDWGLAVDKETDDEQ